MRLRLRFLGGALVCIALTVAAIYLLIGLYDYLEEEIFSGPLPTILAAIYGVLAVIISVAIVHFTIAKSGGELMEIEKQKKERKKREKERKKRESEIEDS